MILDAFTFIVPLVVLIIVLVSMLKVLREYERGVDAGPLLVGQRTGADYHHSDFTGNG